ncbi:unnamed protein product [Scytosiphon promiscuus]
MGCSQSRTGPGLILSQQDLLDCSIRASDCLYESAQAVRRVQNARFLNNFLNAISCNENMTWDLLHASRGIYITPPGFKRDLCLFIVSRTHFLAMGSKKKGSFLGRSFPPQIGHVYLLKHLKYLQGDTLDIEMAAGPSKGGSTPQMTTNMMLQRPSIATVITRIRVSLALAYYGTPPFAVPFTMTLPSSLNTPLPPMDDSVHQADGLRSVFLASWSLDPRAVIDEVAAAGRWTANRIKNGQFIQGQPRFGAIDVGYVASVGHGPGQAVSSDPACVLALVRALQYNTFFTHFDLSMVNASAAICWHENPFGQSDVASGPLSTAVQGLLGWNVTLQSFVAPHLPRNASGWSVLDWSAFGSALLTNPRPMIATWDLTFCGIGDAGLKALLPGWWRIFTYIAPVRELRLSSNGLGQAGLTPFFNMLNGTTYTFPTPQGLAVPPGPLSAPNTSFLTCLELGGCDLRGQFPSLALLLKRCPFLRRLDFSDPLPKQGRVFGADEASEVFGALADSSCPLEELDMRGHWSLGMHTTKDSAVYLATLIARKPTLSRLCLGETSYHKNSAAMFDPFIAAAAIMMWGGGLAANRKAHTVDMSNCLLVKWPKVRPAAGSTAPGSFVLRSCSVSTDWYQGLLSFCTAPHSALRRLDISFSFRRLGPWEKSSLAVRLGELIASSPLEALVMQGEFSTDGLNCLPGRSMTLLFPALGMSKTLLELDVTGHGFGDEGCVALGAALRKNRSITTLSYDHNHVTLEGFQAIRGCLYGNKKLVNVSAPTSDLRTRTEYLTAEVVAGQERMWAIKRKISAAYKYNKPEFRRQIALISANNKAWKALDRENKKTVEVVAVIAECIAMNRLLRDVKVAEKSAAKMERQKGAFEERYATKMGKILTKMSKETDKARLRAAAAKTFPFKARSRKFFYTTKARKRQQYRQQRQRYRYGNRDKGGGMYFAVLPSTHRPPAYYQDLDRNDGGSGEGPDLSNRSEEPGGREGSASTDSEGEELVDVQDNYVVDPAGDIGESSNPLDGVRELILREGPGIFHSSNLGRLEDLFREAGMDVYETLGPLLGEAAVFRSKVADTASSWGTDIGNIFGDIGESAGGAFGGLANLFSDIGDALGNDIDEAEYLEEEDVIGDVSESAGDLAESIGQDTQRYLDVGEKVTEDPEDSMEDAEDGEDGDRGIDDVDMYAGAGPMDLDDEGPTGSGDSAKVLAGPRRLVGAFAAQNGDANSHPVSSSMGDSGLDAERPLIGVGEWTGQRLIAREKCRWEETMLTWAKETDRPDAFPYNVKLHEFRAGRACPSPECRVTLVTQCTADRLHAVTKQALRWGGDISLAVYVPSSPSTAASKTLRDVRLLCDVVDEAVRLKQRERLFLDIAILEGAEDDPARHDRSGALYPVNTLRNLALLQARDDAFHPAQAVFLVDSDCLPSENLLECLHCEDVQDKIKFELDETPGRAGGASAPGPAAIVVPCLEFAPGSENPRAKEHERAIPPGTREMAEMLLGGEAQGFHVDYFPKGHGPTDFVRWATASREEAPGALGYTVPFKPCFEPYVVVDKAAVPMYDERFRGYGMNKVSHLLALATGAPDTDQKPAVGPAEFIVLRKGFVFALPHERSTAWEKTYGKCGDPLRRYQIKALWSKFQGEIVAGLPPVISSSTDAIVEALQLRTGCSSVRPTPPLPPSFRVCPFVPLVGEENADTLGELREKRTNASSGGGTELAKTEQKRQQQRHSVVCQPHTSKEQVLCSVSSSRQESKVQDLGFVVQVTVDRSAVRSSSSSTSDAKTPAFLGIAAPVEGLGSFASSRHEVG